MQVIQFSDEFFDIKATLTCGQIFRYEKLDNGYRVFSLDKDCFIENIDDKVYVHTLYPEYFYNFFDLDTNYAKIYNFAKSQKSQVVVDASKMAKGIRILRQDAYEMIVSFIISQNNNIPKIKKSIEYICTNAGEQKISKYGKFYTFPTKEQLYDKDITFYKNAGLGYRAEYLFNFIKMLKNGFDIDALKNMSKNEIYSKIISIKGVGEKVANCILLFGFYKTKSFPVDTWIEKIYKEDFKGSLTDRAKITKYFIDEFKEYSGYIQQYLFYYKRSIK